MLDHELRQFYCAIDLGFSLFVHCGVELASAEELLEGVDFVLFIEALLELVHDILVMATVVNFVHINECLEIISRCFRLLLMVDLLLRFNSRLTF